MRWAEELLALGALTALDAFFAIKDVLAYIHIALVATRVARIAQGTVSAHAYIFTSNVGTAVAMLALLALAALSAQHRKTALVSTQRRRHYLGISQNTDVLVHGRQSVVAQPLPDSVAIHSQVEK